MRIIIEYFVWYILPGVFWAGFLEWFTTTKLEGIFGQPWKMPERLMHSFFWPLSFLKFAIEFLKGLFGYYDEEE